MTNIKTYQEEYENLQQLGRGGNAEAFLAKHKKFGYICTVRRLLEPVNDENTEKFQKFTDECRRLLLLDSGGHPNIARITKPQLLYHTDKNANLACVEMEYIKGKNIFDFMKQHNGFVEAAEIVNFVKDIGYSLSYCHHDVYEFLVDKDVEYTYRLDSNLKGQKFSVKTDLQDGDKLDITPLQKEELISLFKVTHNDIHEGNVIRKYNGDYILIDFGLAAFGYEGARSSIKKQGVREYWAPERFDEKFSEQTDIYSLGVLAYRMLTGRVPYIYQKEDRKDSYEDEDSQLHRKHADPNIPVPAIEPLRKAACEAAGKKWTGKDYPEWLEKVIMKCLEKKPENRYANGKELYEEVKMQLAKAEKTELDGQLTALTKLFSKTVDADNKEIEKLKGEIESLNRTVDTLKNENEGKQVGGKSKLGWIAACLFFAVLFGVYCVKYYNLPHSVPTVSNNFEATISQQSDSIADLQKRLDEENNNKTLLEKENKTLKKNLALAAGKDKEIAELNKKLSDAQSSKSNATELQRQIDQLKKDKTDLQRQKDKEIADLNKKLADAQGSKSNVADLQRQIEQLKKEKTDLQKDKDETIRQLRNSNSQKDKTIEEKKDYITILEKKLGLIK